MALEYHKGNVASSYIEHKHPFLQLRLPFIEGHGFYMQTMDWLHISWRLRVLYIKHSGQYIFCGHTLDKDNLLKAATMAQTGLLAQDLNGSDKQNYKAILRLCGITNEGDFLDPNILKNLWETDDFRADAMYWSFVQDFLRIFISDCPIIEKIEMAGKVLGFLALWRRQIRKTNGQKLDDHFLTNETFVDVVIAVVNFVLVAIMVRDGHTESGWSSNPSAVSLVQFLTKRFSSRFSEYVFSFVRSILPNQTSFRAVSSYPVVNYLFFQLDAEHTLGQAIPGSKRGVPRGEARVKRDDKRAAEIVAEIRRLTDDDITSALNKGIKAVLNSVGNDLLEVEQQAPLPTFDELIKEDLLPSRGTGGPRTIQQWELKIWQEDEANGDGGDGGDGGGGGGAAAEEEDQDQDEDEDEETGDDDVDEPGSEDESDADDDDPKASGPRARQTRAQKRRNSAYQTLYKCNLLSTLKDMLKGFGLPVGGKKRDVVNRILDYKDRSSLENAVDTAAAGRSSEANTKKAMYERRLHQAVEQHIQPFLDTGEESDSEGDGASEDDELKKEYKKCTGFARAINAYIMRQSRERQGKGNRFTAQGIANVVLGRVQRDPAVEEEIMELAGKEFTLDGDDETWRMREGDLAFEFHPLSNSHFVFYYDTSLGEDPGIQSDDMHKSSWEWFKSALQPEA